MAKRTAPPPSRRPAQLDAQQMTAGIAKLKRRLSELDALRPETIQNFGTEGGSISRKINASLRDVFGDDTIEYSEYEVNWSSFVRMVLGGTSRREEIQAFQYGIESTRAKLQTAIDVLTERLEDLEAVGHGVASRTGERSEPQEALTGDIFVVHGHDTPAKLEVARLLERAGLRVVILHEEPNSGRTIIEKFEAHGAAAGFAVVILTPDDVGGPSPDDLQPRARQNVIGEMFWFSGRLGRSRVCALKRGDIELPSDFAGVGYVDMDERGAWKAELLKELAAAGYRVDWGRALA